LNSKPSDFPDSDRPNSDFQRQRNRSYTIALVLFCLGASILCSGCTSINQAIEALPTDAELARLRHPEPQRDRHKPASPPDIPPNQAPIPPYFPPDAMAKLEITMSNGDFADIYYPKVTQPDDQALRFPIALFLQGLNVDKQHYSRYAQRVARYGFIVIVPNHRTSIRGHDELFAQVGQVPDTLKLARNLTADRKSPLFERIDTSKLVLLGHSHGGMMGLDAVRGACDVPFCVGEYSLPEELKAAVFFGTSLWENGEYLSINNSVNNNANNTSIPVALIAGDRDSLIAIEETRQTYNHIVSPPRALIALAGVNHYGLTDVDNPPGSPSEINPPQVEQTDSIATIARWSGLFLRAHTWNDRRALQAIYRFDPEAHTADPIRTTIEAQLREP
jgi:dienelactone hydrolase